MSMRKNLAIISFFALSLILAGPSAIAEKSPDAIAIRVMSNPSHYSAMRWYEQQGFGGSPQSMEVDGYEAVRDGRTVYVNGANIANQASGPLYTNIYIISYNQNSDEATADVFSEILDHWTFNRSIRDTGNCGIAIKTCSVDKDCGKGGFTCSDGHCSLSESLKCVSDSDCPIGILCTSERANIARDVRRLSDVAEMKIVLAKYKSLKGSYPSLSSGTYLPGRSVSVWPSWTERFAQDLGGYVIDPVNMIGSCGSSFNQTTCWDEAEKRFSGNVPTSASSNQLPAGSLVYTYSTAQSGANYLFCAVSESGYLPSLYCVNGN